MTFSWNTGLLPGAPDLNNMFSWNNCSSGSTTGTTVPNSILDVTNMSAEEYEEALKKQRLAITEQIQATETQNQQINDQIQHIEKEEAKIEAGKKEDGSSSTSMSTEEYEKKYSWWERAGRAIGNITQGCWKMAKSLVGYDENGKWQPMKALKNAAIVVAGVALTCVCPAAGPALLYAGLAAGSVQMGKGIYKACTAKNVEEIDNAWQDVGVGSATVVGSAFGLKGMAKSAGVSAFKPVQLTASQASKGAINFAKNGQVSIKNINWNKTQLPKARDFQFWRSKTNKFEDAQSAFAKSAKERLAAIETEMQTASPAQKALLAEEKALLELSTTKISTATTRTQFQGLTGENSISSSYTNTLKGYAQTLAEGKTVNINGATINPTPENIAMVNSAIQRNNTITSQLNQIATAKDALMRSYANAPIGKGRIEAMKQYTGVDGNRFKVSMDVIYPNAKHGTLWNSTATYGLKGLGLMMPEYLLWGAVTRNPYMAPFKIQDQFLTAQNYKEEGLLNGFLCVGDTDEQGNLVNPTRMSYTAEECQQQLAYLKQQKQNLLNQLT